ncbi:potassium transporter [Luteitalea sp. TBR-22]|uniref:monovalent cation:proton antiporter-2 (CPA2) family protein n=1 Tax=Luteitalea sp. TBR-22 TaxID=2802971 RepID=UPI001AF8475D|nr:monovalent cation:proton antiporter-2 (CPA2) family protein [Luteitalea sp. TBR-22]BCS33649.1 potassium transporter [Luteitalea sp. TBR-22]
MHDNLLAQAFVYLAAAVAAVPLARRLGMGAVLGYLLAGIAIGPFGLRLVADGAGDVLHVAEFGVVMMLFLIGLELRPAALWRMRGAVVGLGGGQIVATAALGCAAGVALGVPWRMALAVGVIIAMSSTAIVLQSLAETGRLRTDAGQRIFAILLSQDIAVIPILAVLPLLATSPPPAAAEMHGVGALPGWQQAIVVLGAVAAIVAGGRYLLRPVFRAIARTGLREIFTATALLLVVGIALLMQAVGLSPALGTFLAGVVLADSEYRHELEGDIEPFKGLLLGLFFISVGAGIDFRLVAAAPGSLGALVLGIMGLKALVLVLVARRAGSVMADALFIAAALCQVGEFAFVLLGMARGAGVLPDQQAGQLVAAVALSMLATPLLLLAHARLVEPRLAGAAPTREADAIPDEDTPVIVAGFGRVGSTLGRLLRASGVGTTVLDLDGDRIEVLRRLGLEAYYGDATRLELLQAAGAARARILVVAVDDFAVTERLVEVARRHFPHLRLIVRVPDRPEAYALLRDGVSEVHRETVGTACDMGYATLRALGHRAFQARRAVQAFRDHDEQGVRALADKWGDDRSYFSAARARIAESAQLLASLDFVDRHFDLAWDNTTLRDEALGRPSAATTPEPPSTDSVEE